MTDTAAWRTPYEQLLKEVLIHGVDKTDRTKTGTKSLFRRTLRFDLAEGFPLITTKRVHFKSVAAELLWFLRGESNVDWLRDHGVTIWDEWADEGGNLGPIYGVQWRSWPTASGGSIDQIANVMKSLRDNPDSRRHIVSAWNVAELDNMALPPCHMKFQFYVAQGKLSCSLDQRSADLFLGVPFNIASYALLVHMVAQQLDLAPGELVWDGGDVHVYNNHLEQVQLQITRTPYPFPQLKIVRKPASIFDYRLEDFVIENYQHHPAIKAEVAV